MYIENVVNDVVTLAHFFGVLDKFLFLGVIFGIACLLVRMAYYTQAALRLFYAHYFRARLSESK